MMNAFILIPEGANTKDSSIEQSGNCSCSEISQNTRQQQHNQNAVHGIAGTVGTTTQIHVIHGIMYLIGTERIF